MADDLAIKSSLELKSILVQRQMSLHITQMLVTFWSRKTTEEV